MSTNSKGMKPADKKRIGQYMDDFKSANGGCLLCKKSTEIEEFGAFPDAKSDPPRLFLYGLCEEHASLSSADSDAEKHLRHVSNQANLAGPVVAESARVVIVDLTDTEKRTYL